MTSPARPSAKNKRSAGVLLYRRVSDGARGSLQVFLVHPGGPFWARKDAGAWSIPKGELEPGEEPLAAAQRELHEETGFTAGGPFAPLGEIQQKSGKRVIAFAAEGDCDPAKLVSATFQLEWPPHSKQLFEVPEVDRGAWFSLAQAQEKLLPAQAPFLERLAALLAG